MRQQGDNIDETPTFKEFSWHKLRKDVSATIVREPTELLTGAVDLARHVQFSVSDHDRIMRHTLPDIDLRI